MHKLVTRTSSLTLQIAVTGSVHLTMAATGLHIMLVWFIIYHLLLLLILLTGLYVDAPIH